MYKCNCRVMTAYCQCNTAHICQNNLLIAVLNTRNDGASVTDGRHSFHVLTIRLEKKYLQVSVPMVVEICKV